MIFSPEKKTRKKFSHRVSAWEKVSGYSGRNIVHDGKYLEVVKYSIPASDVALTDKKIVFFSDLHWMGGSSRETKILREAVKFIDAFRPDVIIYGGDLVSYASRIKSGIDALKSLPAAKTRIAVTGNWERYKKWISDSSWKEFYAEGGFDLLINQTCTAEPFCFYGIDDIKSGSPEVNTDFSGKYNVLLAHSPDTAIFAGRGDVLKKINLILCGHTHGGQVRLPFIGALQTSSRYRLKFDYGHFIHNKAGTHMLVSSGIGMSCVPFRILCRPEIVFIEFVNAI
jgi:predicted MPP superfamily phosphohydrolase